MNSIILNLSSVSDAHAFEKPEEIIQSQAMKAFFLHLQDSLHKALHFPKTLHDNNSFSRIRYHDTIAVFGPRGSGKTTFILNAFEVIRSKEYDLFLGPGNPSKASFDDIEILDILDPTLVEEKDHVFLNIISRIKRRVDAKFSGEPDTYLQEPEKSCSCDKTRGREAEYRDWIACLRDLAAGLPALDGIGTDELKTEKWHDPVHVMEKGLRNTDASNSLERNFHKFVDRSLSLLGKKAFLLAFDDIDTQFKAGWPVLEIIRKYLTTPQLITVISGDLSLYGTLIRDKQWENFSDKMLKCDDRREDLFISMVDKLEDQYLLKILKPERRLVLKTLLDLEERKFSIQVKHAAQEDKKLEEIFDELCQQALFVQKSESKIYRNHVLREPVRGVVQILRAYLERYVWQVREVEKEKTAAAGATLANAREDFIHSLIDVFWVPLQEQGFDPAELKNPSPRTFLNTLVVMLVKHCLLFQGYRLKPEHMESNLNSAFVALGAVLAEMMRRKPFLYFDYFIKVGLTREMSLILPDSPPKEGKGGSLGDYLRATGISAGEDAVTIARFSAGYSRAFAGDAKVSTLISQGTVALLSSAESRKRGTSVSSNEGSYILSHYDVDSWEEVSSSPRTFALDFYNRVKKEGKEKEIYSYINRIDTLYDNIKSWHKHLVTLPVSILLTQAGDRIPVASIFNLIAIIGRVVEVVLTEGDDKTHRHLIDITIKKHSQLRDYRLPVWEGAGNMAPEKADDEGNGQEGPEDVASIDESFARSISSWIKQGEFALNGLPVYVVAKMTTRFSYTLPSVKELERDDLYLGQLLHRFVVAFLNAVLVEEQLHLQSSAKITLKNP